MTDVSEEPWWLRRQGPAVQEHKAVRNPKHEINALLRKIYNSFGGEGTNTEVIYNECLIFIGHKETGSQVLV